MPQTSPELGRHIGAGMPTKLLEVERTFAVVTGFAVAFLATEGAMKPAKARVMTAVRTKVVFMESSCEAQLKKFWGLPSGYNIGGMRSLSLLECDV